MKLSQSIRIALEIGKYLVSEPSTLLPQVVKKTLSGGDSDTWDIGLEDSLRIYRERNSEILGSSLKYFEIEKSDTAYGSSEVLLYVQNRVKKYFKIAVEIRRNNFSKPKVISVTVAEYKDDEVCRKSMNGKMYRIVRAT